MKDPLAQNPYLKIKNNNLFEGILLVNKEIGKSSFSIVHLLRKITKVKKIGHCGTLDPFATGLMVLLIGKKYTTEANEFTFNDKEYIATIFLGKTTNTYDREGILKDVSNKKPSDEEIDQTLKSFQGTVLQTPPMFCAKKQNGKKLYELARKGIEVKREKISVNIDITKIEYNYPYLKLQIVCSKGTYIRSLAYDIGQFLGCGAYLYELSRIRSGQFHLKDSIDQNKLTNPSLDINSLLLH